MIDDKSRLEEKVDALAQSVHALSGEVRSIRENLEARDRLEKQAQIMLAEVNAARGAADAAKALTAAEKASNAEAWNTLKTRALYGLIILCLVASLPGLSGMVRQLRGLSP